MKEPAWLTRAVVIATHEELLSRFGGLDGTRDEGLLESALSRAQHLYVYGTPALFDLATAYAHGVVKNHPFIDGNKRTAFMAAYIFLGINGLTFTAPEEEVVLQTLALAAGECPEAEYVAWLARSCDG